MAINLKNPMIYLILLNICFTIYSIYSTFNSYIALRDQSVVITQVLSNWETKVITDMIATTNQTCQSPYLDSFSFLWPGMVPGCDCSNLDSSQLQNLGINCTICSFSCTSKLTEAGCKPIPEIQKQNLTFWGLSDSQPVKLCVKRDDINYRSSFPLTSTNSCTDGMRICGGTANGSVVNPFCMPNTSLCPVNDIQVSWVLRNDSNATYTCTTENDCFAFQKNSSHVQQVVMNRTAPKLPIAEIAINQYGICEDDTQENLDPNFTKYTLWNGSNGSCSGSGANLWDMSIDSVTEGALLNANGLYDSIASLPNYPMQNMNVTWRLWIRGYVWWDSNCQSEFEAFLYTARDVGSVIITQTIDLSFAILIGVLIGIFIPILNIIIIVQGVAEKDEGEKEGIKKENVKAKKGVYVWLVQKKSVFSWIIKTGHFPVALIALILSLRTQRIYGLINDNLCIAAKYRNVISGLNSQLYTIEVNNIKFFVILVGMIILEFVLWKYQARMTASAMQVKDSFLNKCCKKRKQNQEQAGSEGAVYQAHSMESNVDHSGIELQEK